MENQAYGVYVRNALTSQVLQLLHAIPTPRRKQLVSHGQVTFWMLHPSCNKKFDQDSCKKHHFYVASYSRLSADWTCVKLKCILWPLYEQCIYGCRWPHHAVVSEIYRLDIQLQLTESEIDWNKMVYVLEITLRNILELKQYEKQMPSCGYYYYFFFITPSLDVPLVEFVYIFTCMPSEFHRQLGSSLCVCTTAFKH